MVSKDIPAFLASHHGTATTFLLIGIIITTGILSAFTLVLDQNHIAMAQQPNGTYFQIDNMTFEIL
jgi:hypothetical protein